MDAVGVCIFVNICDVVCVKNIGCKSDWVFVLDVLGQLLEFTIMHCC